MIEITRIHSRFSVDTLVQKIFGEDRIYLDYNAISQLAIFDGDFDDMKYVMGRWPFRDCTVSFATKAFEHDLLFSCEFGTDSRKSIGAYSTDAGIAFLSALYAYATGDVV